MKPSLDFVHKWCTDARGYKNLPSVLEKPEITLVIAGDSFTEGMGIPIEETWGFLLNQRNIATYSLGVQGIAPTMSVGHIKYFGLDLKPSVVALGCSYCVLSGYDYKDPKTGYQYGNMVQFNNRELRAQNRIRYSLSTSAAIHAGLDRLAYLFSETETWLHFPVDWNASSFRQWVVQKIRKDPRGAPVPKKLLDEAIDIPTDAPKLVRRYENEIRNYAGNKTTKEAILSDPTWISVSEALLEFKKWLREMAPSR